MSGPGGTVLLKAASLGALGTAVLESSVLAHWADPAGPGCGSLPNRFSDGGFESCLQKSPSETKTPTLKLCPFQNRQQKGGSRCLSLPRKLMQPLKVCQPTQAVLLRLSTVQMGHMAFSPADTNTPAWEELQVHCDKRGPSRGPRARAGPWCPASKPRERRAMPGECG